MKRYWVSWMSGYYLDEGCTTPPFIVWVTGYISRVNNETDDRDDCNICAVIDAESEQEVWEMINNHFPDYKERFIEEKDLDWEPNSVRFPKK